jgi:hypothetical protein
VAGGRGTVVISATLRKDAPEKEILRGAGKENRGKVKNNFITYLLYE